MEAATSTQTPQETVPVEKPVATDSSQSDPVLDESTEPVATDSSQSDPVLDESTEPVATDSSQSDPVLDESTEPVATDSSQSDPVLDESTEPVATESSQSVPVLDESTEPVATESSQSVPVPPSLQETVSQSASFLSKTSEPAETGSSGGEMVTVQQPTISNLEPVELNSPKTFLDKGIQTGSDVFVSTLLSSSMMSELEPYESDDDYQYENTPSGISELDSKVEYADRLDLASTAFSDLLELETR